MADNNRDDELLEKLRRALGFTEDSDSADEQSDNSDFTEDEKNVDEQSDVNEPTSEQIADEPSKEISDTESTSPAAFDTSVFDSSDTEETTVYQYDEGLTIFSDTLDRFYETDSNISLSQTENDKDDGDFSLDDFVTADFLPPHKEDAQSEIDDTIQDEPISVPDDDLSESESQDDPTQAVGDTLLAEDLISEHTKSAEPVVSSDTAPTGDTVEKTPILRQDATADDRTAFNRKFSTGIDEENAESDSYTEDENGIMDTIEQTALKRNSLLDDDDDDLDSIFEEGAFVAAPTVKRKDKKKKEKAPKEEKPKQEKKDDAHLFEYTEKAQTSLFASNYMKQRKSLKLRTKISVFLSAILLLIESLAAFGVNLPHVINVHRNPGVYSLVLLQLFLLISACAYTYLADGIRSLFKAKIAPESLASVYCIMTLIYGLTIAFTATPSNVCPAYFSPCALCILSLLFYKRRALEREIMGFQIVKSHRPKYVLESAEIDEESRKNNELFDYLPDDASAFKITKTTFVNDLVYKSKQPCADKSVLKYILPIVAAYFIITVTVLAVMRENVSSAVISGFSAVSIVLPGALFTGFSLPFYRSSLNAYEIDSAILSEQAADTFASASVVSFDDTEVFPFYAIRTGNFVTYNNSRPDYIIFAAASVFNKVGGPLGKIFAKTARELELTDNVKILKLEHDGIEAMVDSDNVLIGSAAFMERYNLDPTYSVEDETAESGNNKRVMFIASNGKINAKMRIKYTVDAEFARTIKRLARMGVCIAVMTSDPNIDTGLLSSEIDIGKYPIRVVKRAATDKNDTKETATADIISKGTPKTLLGALSICKKVKASIRTNVMAALLATAIGIMLSLLLLFTGKDATFNSLYIVLYRVFWIILAYVITALSI